MAKKKYLDLYFAWMDIGRLPDCGLCYSLDIIRGTPKDEFFRLIKPHGNTKVSAYWAYGEESFGNHFDIIHKFTPLRQNIVLLMAAMAGEL